MSIKLSFFTAAALALAATGFAQTSNPLPTPVASVAIAETRTPDRFIYLRALPTPAELSRDASARNLTVARIVQTAGRVVVYYQQPDGAITSDAYELLPTAGVPVAPSVPTAPTVPTAPAIPTARTAPMVSDPTVAPSAATTAIAVPTSPAPQVVYYASPAPTYYYSYPVYDTYPAYYYRYPSWGWYAPIGVSLNFGWRGGSFHGGGFRGGFGGGFVGGFRSHR